MSGRSVGGGSVRTSHDFKEEPHRILSEMHTYIYIYIYVCIYACAYIHKHSEKGTEMHTHVSYVLKAVSSHKLCFTTGLISKTVFC